MNFLNHYRNYIERTEPPENYHVWSAIYCASALLGKKCFLPQNIFTIYPNLYIVLVGLAGSRKSTAMGVARDLIEAVGTVPMAPDSITRESLIDDLVENKVTSMLDDKEFVYNQSCACVDEMQEFIGSEHINRAAVGFLISIYDCKRFKERTRGRGVKVIESPFFTLLGCCVTSWIANKLKEDIINDGFARRTIFVLEKKKKRDIPRPHRTTVEEESWKSLIDEGTRISEIRGRFVFTEPACQLWDTFYVENSKTMYEKSEKMQNYFSTKPTLVMKVCMCLSAMVDSSRIISSQILQTAIKMFDVTERNMYEVFESMGRNPLKGLSDNVLKFIEKHKSGITLNDLLREFQVEMNLMELEQILDELRVAKYIIRRDPETVSEVPKYCVAQESKPLIQESLFELVCQLERVSEELPEGTLAEEECRPFDPRVEKLARLLEMRQLDLGRGVLLRGSQHKDH